MFGGIIFNVIIQFFAFFVTAPIIKMLFRCNALFREEDIQNRWNIAGFIRVSINPSLVCATTLGGAHRVCHGVGVCHACLLLAYAWFEVPSTSTDQTISIFYATSQDDVRVTKAGQVSAILTSLCDVA